MVFDLLEERSTRPGHINSDGAGMTSEETARVASLSQINCTETTRAVS